MTTHRSHLQNKTSWHCKFVFALSLAMAGAACTPIIHKGGYNHENFDFSQIIPGKDTTDSVMGKLGSPSSKNVFPVDPRKGGSEWFYISKKTQTTSFFKPETLDQQTIIIAFDAQDKVVSVKKLVGEAQIAISKDKTESTGYETSAIRDIFGNFGRYSGKKKTPGSIDVG